MTFSAHCPHSEVKTSLDGEAKAALEGLSITEANYVTAWNLLLQRYDHKGRLIHHHMASLAYAPRLKEETAQGLQALLDRTTKARSSLQSLGAPADGWEDWFVFFLVQNLDPPTRRDWEKHIGTKVDLPSLETLSEFISGRIRALQSSDLRTPKAPVSYKAPRSAKSFATLSSDLCPECKGDHRMNNCNKFLCSNSRERMAIVRRVQVCFKCLRANHWAGECRSGRPCSVCSSGHHDLLHDGLTRKRSSAGEVGQENLSKKRKFSGANAEVAPGARDAPRS